MITQERILELAEHAAWELYRHWSKKAEENPKDYLNRHGEQMYKREHDEIRKLLDEIRKSRP